MTFHSRQMGRAEGGFARPENATTNKSPRIAICFDYPTFAQLSDEAFRRGVPVAQVVRECVARGLGGEAQQEAAQ